MKIVCSSCKKVVPSEAIDLASGWAKCSACNEVFSLQESLPGYQPAGTSENPTPVVLERPFEAWTIIERKERGMFIHTPATGLRAATGSLLVFATIWLAFIAFWTSFAVYGVIQTGVTSEGIVFVACSTPFWLIGFGLLVAVVWLSRGSRIIYLDASQMTIEVRCLFWRKQRSVDRQFVQYASKGVIKGQNDCSNQAYFPFPVEIICSKKSYQIPCVTEKEQAWVISEVNDFLQNTPA